MYVDEVHNLARSFASQAQTVDDAGEPSNGRTLLSTLTSAWTDLGTDNPTFLILLSTQSALATLAAPQRLQNSARAASKIARHHEIGRAHV